MSNQWICESCVHYPPSVSDGKPCCVCDHGDPLLDCYQRSEYEIVRLSESAPADHAHFNYAVCDCMMRDEAIRFPRTGKNTYHRFHCPRCGASLGLVELQREPGPFLQPM